MYKQRNEKGGEGAKTTKHGIIIAWHMNLLHPWILESAFDIIKKLPRKTRQQNYHLLNKFEKVRLSLTIS